MLATTAVVRPDIAISKRESQLFLALKMLAHHGSGGLTCNRLHQTTVPHTFCCNFVHVVFSTKHRRALIPTESRGALYEYLGGIARNHQIDLLTAGGTENHVHLLMAIGTTATIAANVQKLKTYSSQFMRKANPEFLWQDGFGAFSVSPSQVPVVKAYIARQQEHHRKRDFAAEYSELLRKCGVEANENPVYTPTTGVVG